MKELRKEIIPMWMIFSNEFEKKYSSENLFVELNNNGSFQNLPLTYISTKDNKCQKRLILILFC